MVIADSPSAHEPCPGQESAGYNLVSGGIDEDDVINSWSLEQELRSGKYTLTDYNFKTPSANLAASEPSVIDVGGNSGFEIFDYPGEYATRGDGTAFAKMRMQEEEASHLVANGSSVCRAFTSGYKFTLKDHYQDSMNVSYVLTEVQHIASVGETYAMTSDGGGESYSNHFTCIPETVPFRPARLTPKPFVQGPQTAVVVGKSDRTHRRRRRRRRRDLGRQIRAGHRSVSLGPRQQIFLLGSRLPGLGWPGLGSDHHSPRRPGSPG